jgi:hypothetical protein
MSDAILKPLSLPAHWQQPSQFQRLFYEFPFLGLADRIERHIARELKRRNRSECLSVWEGDPQVLAIRDRLSAIIRDCLCWPNDNFIPADPCQLLLWTTVGLEDVEVMLLLEDDFGLPETVTERIYDLTFGELVQAVCDAQGGTSASCSGPPLNP